VKIPHSYNPVGHVIIGDLNTINDTSLRDVLTKGPTYRGPKSINWKRNFEIVMSPSRNMADIGQNVKRRTSTLSEWVKSVRSLIQIRIEKLNGSMSIRIHQSLKTQILLYICFTPMTNILLYLPTRPLKISFLCVDHIT